MPSRAEKFCRIFEACLLWAPVILMVIFLTLFALAVNGNAWAMHGWGY